MKTILTNEDVKNIVEKAFEENSEKIVLVQEDSNEKKEVELADFLNVKFLFIILFYIPILDYYFHTL